MIISPATLLRMRNISVKPCGENENTDFKFNSIFFSQNTAFYEIMWKNVVEPDKPQITI